MNRVSWEQVQRQYFSLDITVIPLDIVSNGLNGRTFQDALLGLVRFWHVNQRISRAEERKRPTKFFSCLDHPYTRVTFICDTAYMTQ